MGAAKLSYGCHMEVISESQKCHKKAARKPQESHKKAAKKPQNVLCGFYAAFMQLSCNCYAAFMWLLCGSRMIPLKKTMLATTWTQEHYLNFLISHITEIQFYRSAILVFKLETRVWSCRFAKNTIFSHECSMWLSSGFLVAYLRLSCGFIRAV